MDSPEVRALASRYGDPDKVLATEWIPEVPGINAPGDYESYGEDPYAYDKQVMEERSNVPFVDSFASFRMSVSEGNITVPRVRGGEPLRNECEHFLDCITSGQSPLSGGAEGVAVVRALDAISRSLEQGGREIAIGEGES